MLTYKKMKLSVFLSNISVINMVLSLIKQVNKRKASSVTWRTAEASINQNAKTGSDNVIFVN